MKVLPNCPLCGREVSTAEAAAYGGQCEECWVGSPAGNNFALVNGLGKYRKDEKGQRLPQVALPMRARGIS